MTGVQTCALPIFYCKSCGTKKALVHYQRDPQRHTQQARERLRRWRSEQPEKLAAQYARHRERLQALKLSVFGHYGDVCACCGEWRIEFLAIDHVNGDGAEHRKSVHPGHGLYKWIRDHGYPPDFQILCFNCNWAKGNDSECPHQRERRLRDGGDGCALRADVRQGAEQGDRHFK